MKKGFLFRHLITNKIYKKTIANLSRHMGHNLKIIINNMKKLYKLIKLKYENIIIKLIVHPWFIICLGILINITINIIMIYLTKNAAIEPMIPYKHPMMLKLPTIKNICESYDDKIKMLTQNYDMQKLHTFIDRNIGNDMNFYAKLGYILYSTTVIGVF